MITKMDLAEAVEFDEASVRANIQAVRPGMRCFAVSTKTSMGLKQYLQFLKDRLTEFTQAETALRE